VIVEPLGYGLSDQTDTERTAENYCNELHGLMNYLGYDKYTLIGHSMSGIYMTYYSNEYTSEVEAVIGIDEYVPHMRDFEDSAPETQQTVWKISRCYIFLGLDRLMPTYDRESAKEKIPTLTDEEADLFVAMDKTIPTNKTQMNEIGLMPENVDKCYDMKIPENIPVLQVLSKDNCEMYPEYTKIHEDITANSQSRTVAIDGGHCLYFDNLDGLINEIKNWGHK
jgi:pimeloyl-ACP methyl ester carboxylesterase